jgi:hypothetical protein
MMDNPVLLEIIAPVMTDFRHCAHCETFFDQTPVGSKVHRQLLDEYPEDLKEDYTRLSTWLSELAQRYGDTLHIRLIDPQSLEGFFKSVRYWVRRYPAFIISGRHKYIGWDKAALDRALQIHISQTDLSG